MPNKLQTAQAVLLSSVAGMALLLAAPAPALADSLTPDTFSGTVGVGGVIDITDKVGLISAGSPTTALADVMFLVDTTGSMGSAIGNVKTALSGTVSALSAFGSIATGAGQYKDATNSPSDGFDYELNQAITTNSALTQTAIDGFSASGGGDTPEQGLFALTSATTDPATGWRAGAKKIEVIVGDAPAHSEPDHPVAAGGVSVGSTATTLTGSAVTMIALNASSGPGLDDFGQFDASTGLLSMGVNGSLSDFTNAADLTAAIVAAVGEFVLHVFDCVAWSRRSGAVGLLGVVAKLDQRLVRPLHRPFVQLRSRQHHRDPCRDVLVRHRALRRWDALGHGVGHDPRHWRRGSGAVHLGGDADWLRCARLYGLSQEDGGHDVFAGLIASKQTTRKAALGAAFLL